MAKIEKYLKAFNESREHYSTASPAIEFLDKNYPQWRDEIKDPNEWSSLFNYDIHILQNSWLQEFADNLFDIIDNTEALVFVWNSETCNGFYRLAAIQRLRQIDEEKYLPQYIEELKTGKFVLGGWWLPMINELFDFTGAEKVAIDMYQNNSEDSIIKSMGISYLTANLTRYWNEYPQAIKNTIISDEDYSIRKNCTPQIWATLSQSQKFLLIHKLIINEYKCVNDIVNIYNYLRNSIGREFNENESLNFVLYNSHLRMSFDDLKHRMKDGNRLNERDMERLIPTDFDMPQIDFFRLDYRPSRQLLQFKQFSDTPGDADLHTLIERSIRDINQSLTHMRFH